MKLGINAEPPKSDLDSSLPDIQARRKSQTGKVKRNKSGVRSNIKKRPGRFSQEKSEVEESEPAVQPRRRIVKSKEPKTPVPRKTKSKMEEEMKTQVVRTEPRRKKETIEASDEAFDETSIIEDIELSEDLRTAMVNGSNKKGWVYVGHPAPPASVHTYRFKILESPNMQIQVGVTLCEIRMSSTKGR